ncbi:hypothetical protein Pelo_7013 [Pelomyxa schiedti]|nr:hypothetical protein Pelo_7013 [Pelomyxa schiedti]
MGQSSAAMMDVTDEGGHSLQYDFPQEQYQQQVFEQAQAQEQAHDTLVIVSKARIQYLFNAVKRVGNGLGRLHAALTQFDSTPSNQSRQLVLEERDKLQTLILLLCGNVQQVDREVTDRQMVQESLCRCRDYFIRAAAAKDDTPQIAQFMRMALQALEGECGVMEHAMMMEDSIGGTWGGSRRPITMQNRHPYPYTPSNTTTSSSAPSTSSRYYTRSAGKRGKSAGTSHHHHYHHYQQQQQQQSSGGTGGHMITEEVTSLLVSSMAERREPAEAIAAHFWSNPGDNPRLEEEPEEGEVTRDPAETMAQGMRALQSMCGGDEVLCNWFTRLQHIVGDSQSLL